jgi:hypothetical protein
MLEHVELLHLLNLIVAGYLCGLIWFVQLVHYPLMRYVNESDWPRFHAAHTSRTTVAVAWAILADLGLGMALVWSGPNAWTIVALAMSVVALISTFGIQVPLHQRLRDVRSTRSIEMLTSTNWIRTAAWTLRLGLLCVAVS